uniref:PAN domain protein n=1 Tax=Romanomermis culicivorax TaxID=13658 RepID=A0A915IAX2_ROMCU
MYHERASACVLTCATGRNPDLETPAGLNSATRYGQPAATVGQMAQSARRHSRPPGLQRMSRVGREQDRMEGRTATQAVSSSLVVSYFHMHLSACIFRNSTLLCCKSVRNSSTFDDYLLHHASVCSSIIWDDRQHNCYMFAQTVRTNPGILLNRYGTVYYERLPDAGPNCGGACPQKINTAYFVAVGSAISNAGNDAIVVSGLTEEDDCLTACTDQINPKTKGSLGCTALSTLRTGSDVQCIFSTTVRFVEDVDYTGSPSNCFEEFFYLFPQMTLDGHTISSQNSIKSLVDCTNLCITTANCKISWPVVVHVQRGLKPKSGGLK